MAPSNCSCGGKFKRTDIVSFWDPKTKRTMYRDTDTLAAHWKCDQCGRTRLQRKRQPNQRHLVRSKP